MKKRLIILVCILTLLAFVSSASAINRAPKKSAESKDEPTELKEKTKDRAKTKPKSRASSLSEKVVRSGPSKQRIVPKESKDPRRGSESKGSKEKYDYFMDKNNNGIDDRLEKDVKKKRVPKQEMTEKKASVPSEKTPAKIKPVERTPQKVKDTEVKQKKAQPKRREIERKGQSKRR